MAFKKKASEQVENLRSQETQIKKATEQVVDTKTSKQFNHSVQETSERTQETARSQKQTFNKHEPASTTNFNESATSQPSVTSQRSFSDNSTQGSSHTTNSRNQSKLRNNFQEQEQEQERLREQDQEHIRQQERLNEEIARNNQLSHTEDSPAKSFSQGTPLSQNIGSSSYISRNSTKSNSTFSSTPNKQVTGSGSKLTKQHDNQENQTKQEFTKRESSARKLERQIDSTDLNQFKHSSSVINKTGTNITNRRNKTITSDSKLNKGNEKSTASSTTSSTASSSSTTASSKPNKPRQVKSQRMKLSREKLQNGVKGTIAATGAATGGALSKGTSNLKREFEKSEETGVAETSQVIGATAATTKKVVGKLQVKKAEKLKEKKLDKLSEKKGNKNLKKGRENPLSKEKKTTSSLKKVMTTPVQSLKSGSITTVGKYSGKLEEETDGIKVVKESSVALARASKKLAKGTSKARTAVGKINKEKLSKLKAKKDSPIKLDKKKTLQKKSARKKMRVKSGAKSSKVANGIKDKVQNFLKKLQKISFKNIGKAIASKLAVGAAGSLGGILLPVGLIILFVFISVAILGAVTSPQYEETNVSIGVSKNLSPNVERWRDLVTKEANAQGMGDYVDLLLAIIQVESGGTGTADIMQSSESAGYDRPNVWSTPEQSVRQGVKHLKTIVNISKSYGKGYESNVKLLAQAYNFGNYFAHFVGKLGGEYTIEVAEKYSREVVAPSLGNKIGAKYPYVNEVSTALGKPYLYKDGGNFMYGDLVGQYLGGGAGAGANIAGEFGAVLKDLERFQGWPYSWGGKNPQQGFDCSGLTTWGLAQMGINIPSYTVSQWDMTYPVSAKDARPGDLVFFKGTYGGPNFVSHVGFYIDANTMYDSSSSGIGYKDLRDPYWQKHFAGIRRVKGK